MNGSLLCARYSFAPNFFQYCGPDKNKDISDYLASRESDQYLAAILSEFSTLYSYLKAIAHANGIMHPLDRRVVEAYWLGNNLLENMKERQIYSELADGQRLKKNLPPRYLKWLWPKIDKQAKLHHSFHVFNVWLRTGNQKIAHTVETMNQCRIGWGKVTDISDGGLTLDSQQVIMSQGKLAIREKVNVKITRSFDHERLIPGDLVSFHWGYFCDKITKKQQKNLEFYTRFHLQLANETI